jgi:hypothetical protein
VASREVVDHVGHARDLGQVVVDPDLAGCRQPRLRRNRGSSIHRCDKVLATIRRTIAAYAACAIADRRFAAGLRSTGEVEVEDPHRRVRSDRSRRMRPRLAPVCPRDRSRAGRTACRPCGPACTVAFPPMTRRHPGMYSDMYPHAYPGRRAATPGLPERPTAPLPACGCAWPRSCGLDAAPARRAGAPSS